MYKKIFKSLLILVLTVSMLFGNLIIARAGTGQVTVSSSVTGQGTVSVSDSYASAGDKVTVTATPADGYYLAQVRIADTEGTNTTYSALQEQDGAYSFSMPSGVVQVYADFISVKWDGTIDLTWYNPDAATYNLKYPAQLAGAAALTDGLFNNYPTKSDENGNQVPDVDVNGHPSGYNTSFYNTFKSNQTATASTVVVGDCSELEAYSEKDIDRSNVTTSTVWYGGEDFTGKTICLSADLDMGGTYTGSRFDETNWSGSDYMPIGGQYCMDPDNGYTRIKAGFNGSFNGQGHIVSGIYCSRRGSAAGNTSSNDMETGLIGCVGLQSSDTTEIVSSPVIENVAVDGFYSGGIYVGGVVGYCGYVNNMTIQNCMNFSTLFNVKHAGGIVGYGNASTTRPTEISDCANYGHVSAANEDVVHNIGGLCGDATTFLYNNYNLGNVGGYMEYDGQAISAASSQSVFKNCFWLTGSNHATIYNPAIGPILSSFDTSGIFQITSVDTFKTADLLTKLNANTRGFLLSSSANLVSEGVKAALQSTHALSSALNAYDSTGVPVPRTFVNDADLEVPVSITAEGAPVTSYIEGQAFQAGTLKLWANYSDGTKEEVTGYDVKFETGGDTVAYGDTQAIVSVTYKGCSFSKNYTVQVAQNHVSSISVTTVPTNLHYATGEHFNPAGMVVEAAYTNGSTQEITDYTYTTTDALTSQEKEITISYKYHGDTVTTVQEITVLASVAPEITTDTDGKKTVMVKSADDMLWFLNQVSTGLDVSLNATVANDIDLTGRDLVPAGGIQGNVYYGTFNGNGKTICVDYKADGNQKGILFGQTGTGAAIENVILEGKATVSGGGIVGTAEGTQILNCVNKADMTFNATPSGAFAGTVSDGSRVENCINKGSLVSTIGNAGGIAGSVTGDGTIVSGCKNYGTITGTYLKALDGSILQCASTVAGIAGTAGGGCVIQDCANSGDVNAGSIVQYTGGIIAFCGDGTVDSDYNSGKITAAKGIAGGIVGYDMPSSTGEMQMMNCYNSGAVSNTYDTVITSDQLAGAGGIIGAVNRYKTATLIMKNCYDTGAVTATNPSLFTGAVIGYAEEDALENIAGNFALNGSSASAITVDSAISVSDATAAFKSSDELKSLSTVLGSAYTEDTTGINDGYPILSWQTGSVDMVIYLIDSIGNVTADSKDAISAARNAYDRLSDENKTLVSDYDSLAAAETAYEKMVADASSLDTMVSAIGTVSLDSGDTISQARKAYNALTEEEQKLVTTLDQLTEKEKSYHQLVVAAEAAAVDEKISAIGTVSATSGDAISQARKAYDALSDEEKELVTNLGVLTAGESRYALITASYTVSFDANNGTKLSTGSVQLKYGAAIGALPTCQRAGYTFAGWYTAKSGGSRISSETLCTDDVVCYAQWTKVKVEKAYITSLKSGVKKFSVKYQKVAEARGYQVRYSLAKNLASSKYATSTASSKTVLSLKAGKKYYIQVRAYKKDSAGNNIYGTWSSVKSIKVK